jgi:Skp family chaperone for outer membrane proteins
MRYIVPVAALVLSFVSNAAAQPTIGYIDQSRLVAESPQGQRFVGNLQDEYVLAEERVNSVGRRITFLRQRISSLSSRLNAVQLERLENAIERLEEEQRQLSVSEQERLDQLETEGLIALEEVFAAALSTVQTETGVVLIFSIQAVAAADPSYDLTGRTLIELRR